MGSNHEGTIRCCVGSPVFRPSHSLKDRGRHDAVMLALRTNNDLETAIKTWFSIPEEDDYVYYANTSVKLSQVQQILGQGGAKGLHSWYWSEENGERRPLPSPPVADIDSYISIFLPTTATASALKSFAFNAKRSSIRSAVANHIISKRFIDNSHPLYAQLAAIPKTKAGLPCNPYLDFWAWSCHALEWCGPPPLPQGLDKPSTTTAPSPPPEAGSASTSKMIMPPHRSHPLLAIFMHHFGCAIPTHEALTTLKLLAAGRTIADVGSGNGYWTMMLRSYGLSVIPVDSAQSEWRVNWLEDPPSSSSHMDDSSGGTVLADGATWLSSQKTKGGKDLVLLIVYPIVGADGGGAFTRSLLAAYAGDTIAVVGTQNHNGYTGFKGMAMDEYMEREHKNDGWKRVVQIPLPSFAGKDEALFVFQRRESWCAS
ncbi:hypothetical protein QBC37DRAFT_438736 [Rhypophila decipiens]|uniref:Uncharacterized protein n=1 Tax=Rhypophila decipiens TaxID=261697 RepID=A0AAN7BAZ2_9PEZI|nr:hypothetical protein QBC37DRAFT_438736 [Rhypophila decipiens]